MEIINPQTLLVKVAGILEQLNIDYFVTGGMAISVWGRPRATFDIDVVIELIEPKVHSLARALCSISEAGYIDEITARQSVLRHGEFNFIDSDTGLKVDFWVAKNDALSRLKLKRRKQKIIDGQKIYFISPEDLILSKLEWYEKSESTRQLEDVESILKISGFELDMKYLKLWAVKLGVAKTLEKLLTKKV